MQEYLWNFETNLNKNIFNPLSDKMIEDEHF